MNPTITSVLQHISNNLPGLYRLITGGSFLMGVWLVMRSIYQLRQYGELRTMMSVQTELKGPLLFLFVGMILVFWPTLVNVMMNTTFGYSSPLQYTQSSLGTDYNLSMRLAGTIIQFIGFIAFIRGWVLLTTYGNQGGQPVIGKAVAHIIGGLLAINIYATWDIMRNTFGI